MVMMTTMITYHDRSGQSRKKINSPCADFDVAETGSSDPSTCKADNGRRTALGLALSSAVEEGIRSRPIYKERLQIARRVERWVLIACQGEGDIDGFIPIVSTADTVAVITGAAARNIPIRTGAIGHEGVDVSVDGAGDDPFVSGQTLGNDKRVERRQQGIGLRRDRRQRGDGEVSGSRECEEGGRILLDGSERRCHVGLQVRGHGSHGVGYVAELCEFGVEGAQGEEILANRDSLLCSVKYSPYERTDAGTQETETDG